MKKILKCKKGLTLVELIIGMVVLSIIIGMATAVMAPMMQFQRRSNELAEQNTLLDNLANHIIYDVSMAVEDMPSSQSGTLNIPVAAGGGGPVAYTLDNGIIWRNQADVNVPLLPEGFSRNMNVTVLALNQIPDANGTAFMLTIELSNENRRFTRDYAVRPLALNPFG